MRWIAHAVAGVVLLFCAAPASSQTLDDTLLATVPGCDFLDPSACLLPFPNDLFTVPDATTATGKRLNLQPHTMPRNVAGKPIDPTDWNRNDGFSPGTPILARLAYLATPAALKASKIPPQTDMAQSFAPDAGAVLIDADTGERQLIWGEVDLHPETPRDRRVLIIRPGKNLENGHRYIVALRNLKADTGWELPVDRRFRIFRDRIPTANPWVEERRAHMEDLFATLGRYGYARSELNLAWDFTVASAEDRTGRLLSMRDQAFAALGDTTMGDLEVQGSAPKFSISSSTSYLPCSAGNPNACEPGEDSNLRRRIEGTYTVPCFMDKPGCPPAANRMSYHPVTGDPMQLPGNTTTANFSCIVPHSAQPGATLPSLYGHGLFGSASEVGAGNVKAMANEHGYTFCATDWVGMATSDIPNVATILVDLSNFSTLADRVQQGVLNFMFLGRLMIHPDGFNATPEFGGVIDTDRLFYDGNSQGGIIGGALMGVTPDAERGVLGVPGINYSTLLQRSVDFETDPAHPCPTSLQEAVEDLQDPEFDPEYVLELGNFSYACPLYKSYPNLAERQLIFALMQQLWDRAEGNGYAQHIRGGLPDTPDHEVLLHVALADHQVAQVAAEVEARSIGARIRPVAVDSGRSFDVDPQYAIEHIETWPYGGSALEIWDAGPIRPDPANCASHGGGTEVAPPVTLPPRCGKDPHGEPRSTVSARRQKAAFLKQGGVVIDVCNAGPCYSRNWKGSQ